MIEPTEFEHVDFGISEFEAFDLNIDDFAIDGFAIDDIFETRYIKPPRGKVRKESHLKYSHAKKLAKDISIEHGALYYVIVNGSFIFGDFIEALITTHDIDVTKMVISTLSLSQNNVDSLANLLNWGYVKSLDMVVSDYFYSHERRVLIPYMYEKLDKCDRFQLACARVHTKICMFECASGKRFVIHGSANLRSSGNAEQFVFEENPHLYEFNLQYHSELIDRFKTIDKSVKQKRNGNRNRK